MTQYLSSQKSSPLAAVNKEGAPSGMRKLNALPESVGAHLPDYQAGALACQDGSFASQDFRIRLALAEATTCCLGSLQRDAAPPSLRFVKISGLSHSWEPHNVSVYSKAMLTKEALVQADRAMPLRLGASIRHAANELRRKREIWNTLAPLSQRLRVSHFLSRQLSNKLATRIARIDSSGSTMAAQLNDEWGCL